MKTVNLPAYAKVNLYLDIVGRSGGYHMLDTIVSTIGLCDRVIVSERSDGEICVSVSKGLFSERASENDNAYKAAMLFKKTFSTRGANVTLRKKIPEGGGVGGSSADISATLKALAAVYGIKDDLKPLADSLGSDSGYLLSGGYARLRGRGDLVESLDIDKKLYMTIITAEGGVSTPRCFERYDENPSRPRPEMADKLLTALYGDFSEKETCYNALYAPACTINKQVEQAYNALKDLSPRAVSMSGSGSSVFAIFDTMELCLWAKNKLMKSFKRVFVTETLSREEIAREEAAALRLSSI